MIIGIGLLIIGLFTFISAQQTIVSGFGYGVTVVDESQQMLGGMIAFIGLIITIVGAATEGD